MLLAFILFAKIEALTFQTMSLYNVSAILDRPITLAMIVMTLLTITAGIKYIKN